MVIIKITMSINSDTSMHSIDVNECTIDNGNCSQVCTNAIGSYTCSCRVGYALDINGRICNGKL